MHEEPGVHSLHAGAKNLPWSALDRLSDKRVLGDQEVDRVRERPTEFLELLHGEAFEAYSSEEVALLELFLDGIDGLFFPGSANGGADRREAEATGRGGGGEVRKSGDSG